MIRFMYRLKTKKILLLIVFICIGLKIFPEIRADYSKIDELYDRENFTIFLIFKEDPYKVKEIFIVLSDFDVEKRFRMQFDQNRAFVSIPFDSLPQKDFYYYFEFLTKDNRLEHLPEIIQERMKNLVKFIKEKKLKKEIILLLPEGERKIDPDNFTFSVYIPDGTKDVKIVMDGEDITEKCVIGEKILTYAPEKFLKPSKYRIDVVKEGKLVKTYYFNISSKDFILNLFNGEILYNSRYEPGNSKNFFNSYSFYFYGNVSNFLYNVNINNNFYLQKNFWNNFKINIHLNFRKFNFNFLDLYYYDNFSDFGFIHLKGFSFSYKDPLFYLSNITGKLRDIERYFSSFTFERKLKFYGLNFENLMLKDSLFYLNFKLNNNIYVYNKRIKLFYNISSPFVSWGNGSLNDLKELKNFSQKFGSEIDLKKYYTLFYITNISQYIQDFSHTNYTKFFFKNQIFITEDLVLMGDFTVKNHDQNRVFFINSLGNDIFTNLNLIYSNKSFPYLFFSITNNIFSNENNDKNLILKTTTGTSYSTKFENYDLLGKFFINQTNYKFSEEDKKLLTEYDILFSTIYKSTLKTFISFKTLISEEEIERKIDEKYGLYLGYINSENVFSTGVFTQFFLKKDFGGLKKLCLSFSPDIKLKIKSINLNFYPCFCLDILNKGYYWSLSVNSSMFF